MTAAVTTFNVPEPFVWDKTFEVGYNNLDEQHKLTFMAILDLANNPNDQMRLDCMTAMIRSTCLMEEVMMKVANNPDFISHKAAHNNLMEKLEGLCCPLTTNEIQDCKEWLVDHIMTMDMQYKNTLYTYPM